MANQTKQSRRSVLSGPSAGVLAWTTYWMGIVDWLIDARRRWHRCAQGSKQSLSLTASDRGVCAVRDLGVAGVACVVSGEVRSPPSRRGAWVASAWLSAEMVSVEARCRSRMAGARERRLPTRWLRRARSRGTRIG